MSAEFTSAPGGDVETLRRDVRRYAGLLDDGAVAFTLLDIAVGATETAIAHGLGNPPKMVIPVPQASATVYRTRAPDSKCIYLAASVAVTCDLLVVP